MQKARQTGLFERPDFALRYFLGDDEDGLLPEDWDEDRLVDGGGTLA
jgi:hypothetical protein